MTQTAIHPNPQTRLFEFSESDFKKAEASNIPLPSDFKPKFDPNKTNECVKEITKHLNKVNYKFESFLDISLSAVQGKEDEYMGLIKNLDKQELMDYANALGILQNFFLEGYYDDVLGTYYQQNYRNSNGYFITPFNVSLMMAKMLDPKAEDVLYEPCCGSGSMLLAAKFVIHEKYGWKKSCYYLSKMHGADIGTLQVKMCKLQLLLTNYLYMIYRIYDAVNKVKIRTKNSLND